MQGMQGQGQGMQGQGPAVAQGSSRSMRPMLNLRFAAPPWLRQDGSSRARLRKHKGEKQIGSTGCRTAVILNPGDACSDISRGGSKQCRQHQQAAQSTAPFANGSNNGPHSCAEAAYRCP